MNVDESLQTMVQSMMKVSIIIHTLVSIWICGGTDIFYESPTYKGMNEINKVLTG